MSSDSDQVYSNTRVRTQVNANQYETRVRHNTNKSIRVQDELTGLSQTKKFS